jgi:hypothetical protein
MPDDDRPAFHVHPGLRQGLRSEVPLPTRLVSNEEFPPLPQTTAQAAVEHRILAAAGRLAPRLGLSRRDFRRTNGGMATSLLAMNAAFGRFFDVLPVEAADPVAFQERTGPPVFIFDLQLHYVGAGYDPANEEAARKGAVSKGRLARAAQVGAATQSQAGVRPRDPGRPVVGEHGQGGVPRQRDVDGPDLHAAGTLPARSGGAAQGVTHIRDEINRVTQSRRMLAHGLITPQLGQADLDFMDQQAATLKVDAWKGYTGAAPRGFDRGWFVDDEKIAYPMLERARKLGVKRVCLHKGLPLGPVADYNHPRDVIKAARDFPDIDSLVYHAGLQGVSAAKPSGDVPWTTELGQMKKKEPGLRNIYMELGSTFGQLVTTNPTACAHLLGQIVDAFGADHAVGHGLDLVRNAAVADRGVPALRDPGGSDRRAQVRAAHAGGEGADLRAQRGAGLRRRRQRQTKRDPPGLPEPHEASLPRRRPRAEPPLVRLGRRPLKESTMGDRALRRLTWAWLLAAAVAGCGGLTAKQESGWVAFHVCQQGSASASLEDLLEGGRVNYRTQEGVEFASMKACMERRGYDCDLGLAIGARPHTHCYPKAS